MTCVYFKDYQGLVSFEDDHLVVKILHIDDSVSTIFDSASNAQNVFEELVEDYIETCAEVGKEPCKPHKGSFNVRVTPETHRKIALMAAENGETLNAWVSRAIDQSLHMHKSKEIINYAQTYSRISEVIRAQRSVVSWEFGSSPHPEGVQLGDSQSVQQMLNAIKRPRLHG